MLSELIERWPGGAAEDPSVQRFAELRDDIEKIKTQGIVRTISELAEMKQRNPEGYERLAPRLREILDAAPGNHPEKGSDDNDCAPSCRWHAGAAPNVNAGHAVARWASVQRLCPDAVDGGWCVGCRLSWKLVIASCRFWVGAGQGGHGRWARCRRTEGPVRACRTSLAWPLPVP